jgi:hypothetical protein
MNALLRRFADSPFGVFGFLDLLSDADERLERFTTCEDDWWNNAPDTSCIPAGRYRCVRSPFHGGQEQTFEVTDVPGRSRILFHGGNTEEHTKGCILLGLDFGAFSMPDEDLLSRTVRTKWGITGSATAFRRFLDRLVGIEEFGLEVIWAEPGGWRGPPRMGAVV